MFEKIKYYYDRLLPAIETMAIRKKIILGQRNYQKFILLGTARVGSTLLQSYLNMHPEIYCEGEIYNTDHLKMYGKPDVLIKQMNDNPLKYLKTYGFPEVSRKIKHAGFKLFYNHFQTENTKTIRDYLVKNKDIKIIHIKRKNMLRNLVSLKIAEKTNEWRSFSEKSNIDKKRICLTKEECLNEFESLEKIIATVEQNFKEHQILDVFYKDLSENTEEVMLEVFGFLGAPQISVKKTALKKQNREKLSQLVLNFHELKKEFQNTKWTDFFEE